MQAVSREVPSLLKGITLMKGKGQGGLDRYCSCSMIFCEKGLSQLHGEFWTKDGPSE